MNASSHPELLDTRTPSDLRRAFDLAAQDAGLPLLVLPQAEDLFRRFADHYLTLRALPRRARRALKRRWARSVATLALLLALGEAPAFAATIQVGIGCTLMRVLPFSRTASSPATSPNVAGASRAMAVCWSLPAAPSRAIPLMTGSAGVQRS